jgi:hypothetical protein
MGCGLGQGYLVARPMAAHGIEALAADGDPGEDGDHGTGGEPAAGETVGHETAAGPAGPAAPPEPADPASPSRDAPAPAPAS